MIQEIHIDKHVLKYQLTIKNNKNTYFYFKKEGYIQINASKYQSHKGIIKFIKQNSESFISKYEKMQNRVIDKDTYLYFGKKYKKVMDNEVTELQLDHLDSIIKEPNISIDQLQMLYRNMEKKLILEKLEKLKDKYLNNGLIDIREITFKTRYMQTRFGSCNTVKKAININQHLISFDEKYLEYIFLHEISHLVHQNHSKDYYQLLGKLSNNYAKLKKELNYKFIYR